MPCSVPWKLQKSSISKGKVFLLSDPGLDLNQMPFLVPNEGSFPLGVIPWHMKNSSGGNATGLGKSREEAKWRGRSVMFQHSARLSWEPFLPCSWSLHNRKFGILGCCWWCLFIYLFCYFILWVSEMGSTLQIIHEKLSFFPGTVQEESALLFSFLMWLWSFTGDLSVPVLPPICS